jgi:hypothetical protein
MTKVVVVVVVVVMVGEEDPHDHVTSNQEVKTFQDDSKGGDTALMVDIKDSFEGLSADMTGLTDNIHRALNAIYSFNHNNTNNTSISTCPNDLPAPPKTSQEENASNPHPKALPQEFI